MASLSRPVVHIRPANGVAGRTYHVAWCATDDCEFVYIAAVKTDAQEQARWHRDSHRQAR